MSETKKRAVREEQEWLEYELREVSLGDKRLDWRLLDTASKLAAHSQSSINAACEDWADTKASYRLFENDKTTAAKILQPHYQRTGERTAGYERVLAIQDTTYLNYSHHPAKAGLGPIGTTQQQHLRGLVMHTTLITTLKGLPLGVISQEIWARAEQAKQRSPTERSQMPIEHKESYKWLTGLKQTVERLPAGTQVISVGDCEADIFELFDQAVNHLKTDLLIRAAQDRCVCEPEVGYLWSSLSQQKIAGHLKVKVPKRGQQPKREAIVSVRYTPLTLKVPLRLRQRLSNIPLFGVLVQEEDPPPGVEPLSWLLLTTVPVLSFEDAVERVQWYRQRWQIEIFYKVLKSGCQIEKAQLATTERLEPLIALFSIIAWRLFWLTHIGRHEPEAPCTTVLTEPEWQALYAFTHKTEHLPDQPPSVRTAIRWIAQLGGFLARRHDGEPGVTVIWRGWQRLTDITASWLIFHPTPTCG